MMGLGVTVSWRCALVAAVAAAAACASSASAQVIVYNMNSNNGFFTPFNPGNANTGIRYGDSGWLGGPGSPPVALTELDLNLATFGSLAGGLTDLKITVNDGDPSGLVFGSGAPLFSTTITNVTLPADVDLNTPTYFTLSIPLPAVLTLGGFNNVGFSVECKNYNFAGQFGFQASNGGGAGTVGFFTNNASFYDGSTWSLFSFGGPAIFSATFQTPAPGAASLFALGGVAALRRRR